jgi:hypothetical protein
MGFANSKIIRFIWRMKDMGLFRKESSTRIIRDSKGKVINVIHEGDDEHETAFDRAAQQRQANREARANERNKRRYDRKYQRKQEREAYRNARNEERIKLKAQQGRLSARHPVTAILPPRRIVHVHVGKKQYQKQFKKKGYSLPVKKTKPFSPEDFQKKIMKGLGHR